jgi:EAL domain-containing protein (putative c-di-GMP-specific phosphodiesterase class I)
VNVSARQFRDPFLPDRIRRVLNEAGLPGSALELEITESEAMHNMDLTLLILKQLRDMGVHISIDDFGTSYSSLGYLKRLSVSRIKIDYSFVRGLPDDEEAASIVQAIIALAHALKLDVVAEGVETSAQRALLTQWTCDYIQGYLICKPARPADLDLLLRSLPQQ